MHGEHRDRYLFEEPGWKGLPNRLSRASELRVLVAAGSIPFDNPDYCRTTVETRFSFYAEALGDGHRLDAGFIRDLA